MLLDRYQLSIAVSAPGRLQSARQCARSSAEISFFDDLVEGALARRDEIDQLITERLAEGWSLERLDKPMKAILRVGAYELIARPDVPMASVISEYVDVADAFYDQREKGFVNGLLDAIAKAARPAA